MIVLALWIALAGALSFSYLGGLFYGSEHFFEDLLVSKRPVDSRIVILAIDDESLARFGQWPWPRSVFANIFERLEAAHPQAVGFDVVLADPSRYGSADDARLARALARISYPLVLPVEADALRREESAYLADRLTRPLASFLGARTLVGHVNLALDADGVARTLPLAISFKKIGRAHV